MTPLQLYTNQCASSRTEEAECLKRLLVALGIVSNNLIGEGLDFYKPLSATFAAEIGQLCRRAIYGEADDRLDDAVRNSTIQLVNKEMV